MGSTEDKIIERVMKKYFLEDPEPKLLIKFQIYMLLFKNSENSTILHHACM